MAPRLPDALLYRYTSTGVIAHTVVCGHETIRAFQRAGWSVLVHSSDVRYADLEETRELDVTRFQNWQSAWLRQPWGE